MFAAIMACVLHLMKDDQNRTLSRARGKDELQTIMELYRKGEKIENLRIPPVLGRQLQDADVFMFTAPIHWCRIFLGLGKPLLLVPGLPVLWDVRDEDREVWAAEFTEILKSPAHVVFAMTSFVAVEIQWQFGIRIPTIRIMGLHTKAVYAPLENSSILVSRSGTSGALSECILQRFLDANLQQFPFQFVQLEALLFSEQLRRSRERSFEGATSWKDHTSEIKVPEMPYMRLARHRAAICLPYDAIIFLFSELYSANVPVFVPRDLWRWITGPLTMPQMEIRGPDIENVDLSQVPWRSPFYASVHRPMEVEQGLEWASYSDWALLPHLRYFSSVPDILLQLLDSEALHETSAKMKSFNDEELVITVEKWRRIAHRLVYAVELTKP